MDEVQWDKMNGGKIACTYLHFVQVHLLRHARGVPPPPQGEGEITAGWLVR